MSVIALPRRANLRHLAFTLVLIGLFVIAAWMAAGFLKPQGFAPPAPDVVLAGRIKDFSPDSVNTFREHRFHLVRLEDGSFLALSMRGYRGCTTPWRADFSWYGQKGAFVEPCSGVAYDKTGRIVSVPTIAGSSQLVTDPDLRGLDQFRVEIRGDEVWVNIKDVMLGAPASGKFFGTPIPAGGPDMP